jgi:hypothetical protein
MYQHNKKKFYDQHNNVYRTNKYNKYKNTDLYEMVKKNLPVSLQRISNDFENDLLPCDQYKTFLHWVAREYPRSLEYIKPGTIDIKELQGICTDSLRKDGWALSYVFIYHAKYLDYENIVSCCHEAVKQNPLVLKYIINSFAKLKIKDLHNLCQIAVSINGLSLAFIPDKMKDKEIAIAAINQNKKAFEFIPYEIKKELSISIQNYELNQEQDLDINPLAGQNSDDTTSHF